MISCLEWTWIFWSAGRERAAGFQRSRDAMKVQSNDLCGANLPNSSSRVNPTWTSHLLDWLQAPPRAPTILHTNICEHALQEAGSGENSYLYLTTGLRRSDRRMAKKGSHTHHISLLTNGWSTWDFFLEIARGKEGLSSKMIMMLLYSLLVFFAWTADFYRFCSGQIPFAFDYPNLHMYSFEQHSALGNLSQL